ncbi:hypothetical protein LCGC14_2772770, partial [marine sediment metagenome]
GMARPGGWIVAGPKGEPMVADEIPPDTPWNRWMVPVNSGRPRLVKTPLPYWVIAALAKLTGEVNEWTARAQSAISALLTALIVLGLGRAMFRPRVALLGALMFVTTVGFQKWGRNARPEMMLCLYMTAAMACFYMGLTAKGRPRRAWWMLAFWGAMGLANLTKQFLPLMLAPAVLAFVVYDRSRRADDGQCIEPSRRPLATCLIGWAVAASLAIALHLLRGATDVVGPKLGLAVTAGLVVLSLLWYAVTTRGYRGVWPLLPTAFPGAVIMFAAFVPWMLYMRELFPQASAVFGEQLTERAAGVGKWAVTKPQPYLVPLVMLTLPWLAFLPGAFAAPWLKCFAHRRRPLVYLFLWSAGLIGMLILSAGKRDHYILPAIPAVCLLMGFVAEDVFFTRRWLGERLARRLGAGHGAAALA